MEFGDTLVAITAVVLGCTIVLIPIAGLTARFAIKPMIDSWLRMREAPGSDEHVRMIERRVAMLEKQVEVLERDNSRLLEDADFRERLRS
jgi:hypothetical protein